MRSIIQLPGFQSTADGQPATCALQVGPKFTYNNLAFSLTADGVLVPLVDLPLHVDEIRVEADGDVLRRITPLLLADYLGCKSLLAQLKNGAGADIASGIIPFSDPTRRDVIGEELTDLGTVGVGQLLLVLVLKSPIISPATTPPVYALDGVADVTTDKPKRLAVFERWAIDSFAMLNGTAKFNTVPIDDDLFGILFHSSLITHVAVLVDNKKVFDAYKADIENQLRNNGLGLDTAAYFPWIMDFSRQVTDRLVVADRDTAGKITGRISDLVIEVTATGAAQIPALRRTFDY